MSRGLLVVINVGSEDYICDDFLPYWNKSGCDVIFSSPEDNPSRHGGFVCGLSYNRDKPSTWSNYQRRVLGTMKLSLEKDYDWFCFTQYDSVCFGQIPPPSDGYCVTHIAGFGIDGLGKWFVHPPWIFPRETLAEFIKEADNRTPDLCRGVMDFWMAHILEMARIPVLDSGGAIMHSIEGGVLQLKEKPRDGWSWSENHIDTQSKVDAARAFYKKGGLFLHGVKDAATLAKIVA